jgi:biopolymer transport protein ExbD
MKFRKKHRTESEVFTDSLNDILFILLMFFLITTTQANPNVKTGEYSTWIEGQESKAKRNGFY